MLTGSAGSRLWGHSGHVAPGGRSAVAVSSSSAPSQVDAPPGSVGVVRAAVVVGVEELLEPLDELEVVLEAALDQPVHRDDLQKKNNKAIINDRSLSV